MDPKQAFGPDKIIPPSVLSNAKVCHPKTLPLAQAAAELEIRGCIDLFEQGLAIITVLKAGFLFSGRVGSGLVIARKSDGCESLSSLR